VEELVLAAAVLATTPVDLTDLTGVFSDIEARIDSGLEGGVSGWP